MKFRARFLDPFICAYCDQKIDLTDVLIMIFSEWKSCAFKRWTEELKKRFSWIFEIFSSKIEWKVLNDSGSWIFHSLMSLEVSRFDRLYGEFLIVIILLISVTFLILFSKKKSKQKSYFENLRCWNSMSKCNLWFYDTFFYQFKQFKWNYNANWVWNWQFKTFSVI